ncbi:TetR/AcrR family transcriptional regulator [Pontibacter qinzhouensis]|uniref:TetR/AcrR family transcriptional regulator n=1 Tax=Pontibacter qinzhouensis TaxID=2603253 RepID=A0A5C8KD16_9BACT|nr:TetR/AcrR family transcriptional regulator C-terminal domain-containing protein [Pontibacter qinzhouensis]TXK51311.1 TetR/AcrR family transcriptional regulator [Pontibacter qinzhouensis]
MTFLETILEEILRIFKRDGIEANTQEDIIKRLDIRHSTFQELFSSKADMVLKVVRFDIKEQERQQARLLANAQDPVEEVMLLLQDGIKNIQQTNPQYVLDLQQHYEEVWLMCLEYLNSNSYHLISEIINRGILQGLFRKDINIELVTRIILAQLNMMLNPQVFPPEKYNLSEVYRSIFLYYLRGICTEPGGKLAEAFFAKHNL